MKCTAFVSLSPDGLKYKEELKQFKLATFEKEILINELLIHSNETQAMDES